MALIAATAAGGSDAGAEAHEELLDLIVKTAAAVLDTEAASLFVIDAEAEELIFQVALGGAGDMLRGQRIPLGTGIVGFVAATGSPLTVNSVKDDPRFAASFAAGTGYVPENILAVPLIDDDDVVGVLEVLNKHHGRQGFVPKDIEVLSMFANQAAVALRRSLAGKDMLSALKASVEREAGSASDEGAGASHQLLRSELAPFALRISDLIHDVGSRGEPERRLVLALLEALRQYVIDDHAPR
jgi:signal transduction protein with GAF and PtsI domain